MRASSCREAQSTLQVRSCAGTPTNGRAIEHRDGPAQHLDDPCSSGRGDDLLYHPQLRAHCLTLPRADQHMARTVADLADAVLES